MTLPAALALQVQQLGIDPSGPDLLERVQAEIKRRCEEQAERRRLLERQLRAYPLAGGVLWRAPRSECDQRRSVVAAMSNKVTVVLGGERSGKSLGLKHLTLAQAIGGDHPLVKAWGQTNDLPVNLIPPGPAEVYVVSLASGDSKNYHRPDFAQLVGDLPHHWHNQNGQGEAELTISVPGYSRNAIVHFKSVDQGPRSFQGISLRWVWMDEEPEGHKGEAVFKQCLARVMDQNGKVAISMVPLLGYTWVYTKLIQKRENGALPLYLDALDNPHFVSREAAESHYGGMEEKEREARRYGRFTSRSNVIYPQWKIGDGTRWGMGHTCEPFEIPPHWPRFRAGDFGLDNPTCVGWAALSTDGDDDGTLYFYREYYRNGHSYPWHAERARALECGQAIDEDGDILGEEGEQEPIETGWGDPSASEGREAFANAGVGMGLADNDLETGYSKVRDRLRLRSDDRPRLKVFTTCPKIIEEMGGLLRDPKRVDLVQVKKNDHAADMVRYMVCGVDEWNSIIAC